MTVCICCEPRVLAVSSMKINEGGWPIWLRPRILTTLGRVLHTWPPGHSIQPDTHMSRHSQDQDNEKPRYCISHGKFAVYILTPRIIYGYEKLRLNDYKKCQYYYPSYYHADKTYCSPSIILFRVSRRETRLQVSSSSHCLSSPSLRQSVCIRNQGIFIISTQSHPSG